MSQFNICIIAAVSKNGCIGHNNKIPWHYSEDLENFKLLTIGCPIIMGRKTFESIGHPLKNRVNIILTHNEKYKTKYNNVAITYYIEDTLHYARLAASYINATSIFIIGGSKIYENFMSIADTMFITEVNKSYDGDTYFPVWPILPSHEWKLINKTSGKNKDLCFLKYERFNFDRSKK